jgi:transcriptional regulator with XRE-family HTH domain
VVAYDIYATGNKIVRRSIFHPYFGERIKYFREKVGLSQQELFSKLGYKSTGRGSQIEGGTSGMAVDKVALLCKLLDCEPEVLMWPNEIDEEDLDTVNRFFRVLKNKDSSRNFEAIKTLIFSETSDHNS